MATVNGRGLKPMSPHVASWLGTFIAAGVQLTVSSREEKNSKLADKRVKAGMRMGILGPGIGLALWKLFTKLDNRGSVLPVVVASLIGSGMLKTEDEVESVNNVIWLRIASGIWSALGRNGIDLLTHMAIMTTFYGVVNHTAMAPSALVKMTRRFLSPPVFDSIKNSNTEDRTSARQNTFNAKEVVNVFLRSFKGLFAYNYFLHFSAALVAHAVRIFGSKAVDGVKRSTAPSIRHILIQAAKEATILNTAVSASCALLVAGSRLGGSQFGVFCMPFPLYFCASRVRDTVYFLFIPWCVKYLFRLHDVGDILYSRVRLLLGVYMLEGPLRVASNDHEGYAWMISVAFGLVKSAGAGLI